jgi:hypothetical protein
MIEVDERTEEAQAAEAELREWDKVRIRLREQADRDTPPAWQPESEGDELLGTVVGFNPAAPTAYGPSPVLEVRTPVGEHVSLWLLSTVLRRAFERANVHIGETILVRYSGMKQREGAPSYHDYKLVVDRPVSSGARIDWRAVAEAHDDVDDREHEQAMADYVPPDSGDDDIPF